MVIDELVTILGIEIASSALPDITKFNSKLDSVVRYSEGVAAAATVAGVAIFSFVDRMAGSAADIYKFSLYTGMSTDAIQKWSHAVEQAGGSASDIKGDLVSLEKALNPLMPQRFNQGLYMMFGSGYKDIKNSEEALLKISDKMKGMTSQRQLQWADILGLSPGGTAMVQRGRGFIENAFKEMQKNLLSREQTEKADRFTRKMNDLKMTFYKTGESIVTKLLPGIIRALDALDKWIDKNQVLIGSGLDRFVKGVADGFDKFVNGLGELKKHLPAMGLFFDLLMDPRLIGGTVLTALTGISVVLGVIALKYALIGAAVLSVIAAVTDFNESNELDKNGKMKDTLLNRAHKWLNDHGPKDENGHGWADDRYGTLGKKGVAAGLMDNLKGMLETAANPGATSMATPLATAYPAPVGSKYTHLAPPAPSAPITNYNTVNVYGQSDPYSTANEATNRLRQLTGTDFISRSTGGNGQ